MSERVREVRERRAREAAAEALQNEIAQSEADAGREPAPQLELLPRPTTSSTNPLVEAALRRIDRANHRAPVSHPAPMARVAVASAISHAHNSGRSNNATDVFRITQQTTVTESNKTAEPLPSPVVSEPAPVTLETPTAVVENAPDLAVIPPMNDKESEIKPRRLIADGSHEPALNYLDSIQTAVRVEVLGHSQAPSGLRLLAAIVDLVIVVFLASPFAAAIELINGSWDGPLVLLIAGSSFLLMTFLYGTIATALTGKTLGMKLLALRVIDVRSGLIPTGSQSATRALLYVAWFLTLGSGIIYAIIDREKRPAHDRLTRTAVVRSETLDEASA